MLWLCIALGSTVGGLLPELWGASGFGLQALLGGTAGAAVGVWAAVRLGA